MTQNVNICLCSLWKKLAHKGLSIQVLYIYTQTWSSQCLQMSWCLMVLGHQQANYDHKTRSNFINVSLAINNFRNNIETTIQMCSSGVIFQRTHLRTLTRCSNKHGASRKHLEDSERKILVSRLKAVSEIPFNQCMSLILLASWVRYYLFLMQNSVTQLKAKHSLLTLYFLHGMPNSYHK